MDVNAMDPDRRTPLMWAAYNNNDEELINLLIKYAFEEHARGAPNAGRSSLTGVCRRPRRVCVMPGRPGFKGTSITLTPSDARRCIGPPSKGSRTFVGGCWTQGPTPT